VPTKPYSPVVISDDLVAVSGQIPVDERGELVAGGFADQVEQVFRNLTVCLEATGCDLDDVIKVVAYLTDRSHAPAFNDLYAPRFAEPRPVRTTIVCGLLDERFLVEIDVLARRPHG
jgi:enamine deaminase RidA (YjgF/YER057c/UK114 family)